MLGGEVRAMPVAPACEAPDLEAAFIAHGASILGFLRRLGLSRSDAEDALSETFVVAHEAAHRYDPERPLRPWLYGIALNQARRHRRLRHRALALVTRLSSFESGAAPGPDVPVLQREEAQRVQAVLARLSFSKRTLLVLREIEGLSVAEIAETLGRPKGSVCSGLYHARRSFLKLYRQRSALEVRR